MAKNKSLVDVYREKFGEPPPSFGYAADEWPELAAEAVRTGKPMKGAEEYIPKDAVL